MARLAQKHGYSRIDFSVLNWNPARILYERLGAEVLDEWVPMRLEGDALRLLASNPEIHAVQIKQDE